MKAKNFLPTPLSTYLKGINDLELLPTWEEMVEKFGVPMNTAKDAIQRRKRKLRRDEKPKKAPPKPKAIKEVDWAALTTYDRPTRRKAIEQIIMSADKDGDRLRALDMLEELDRASSAGLGPRPPLTDEEKIERLGKLMCACSPAIVDMALKLAQDYWKEEATWAPQVIYAANQEAPKPENPEPQRPEAIHPNLE